MNKSIFHCVLHACAAALILVYMSSLAEVRQDYREAIGAMRNVTRAYITSMSEPCAYPTLKEQ